MTAIRVLIADDHPLIVEGIAIALKREQMEVVGSVNDATEVLPQFSRCEPDVLVLDVRFQASMTGLGVARGLLNVRPNARIVFYSQFDQDELIHEAYRLGAMAFVVKTTSVAVLAGAIRQVASGKTFFMPEIAERLALMGVRGTSADSPQAKLEARELEVFKMIARGQLATEIAASMDLSLKAISMISIKIKDKLGTHRAAELTLLAVKHKLIEP